MTTTSEQRVSLRWIPKDAHKVEHALGVCYLQDELVRVAGRRPMFTVLAYAGTARKSSFYESYATAEARDKRVTEFFSNLEHSERAKAGRKAERAKPHTLVVGDIIYNSWGYDQTNIDFYRIVKTTAHFVWLQPIACEKMPAEGCSPMSGYIQPELPVRQILTREARVWGEYDEVSGERPTILKTVEVVATMHKAESNSVLFKHGCGSLWDGRPKYESWYA